MHECATNCRRAKVGEKVLPSARTPPRNGKAPITVWKRVKSIRCIPDFILLEESARATGSNLSERQTAPTSILRSGGTMSYRIQWSMALAIVLGLVMFIPALQTITFC